MRHSARVRILKIAIPLAALTLLTGACGSGETPAGVRPPIVSPSGGPALKRVWQIKRPSGLATVIGNVVVTEDARGGLDFVDGGTGRITGRVAEYDDTVDGPFLTGAIDNRGRPLVTVHTGEHVNLDNSIQDDYATGLENVYDTTGRLVWKSDTDEARYDGGYVAKPQEDGKNSDGEFTYRMQVRAPSGKIVDGWPLPGYNPQDPRYVDLGGFQAVRPGLLVATRWNNSAKTDQVFLIDVSRPGKAREIVLRPPFKLPDNPYRSPAVTVAGGRLYVSWENYDGHGLIARYDIPSRRPLWHRSVSNTFPELHVSPGPNGGGDVVELDGTGLLRADTGARFGPSDLPDSNGPATAITWASGGRAYFGFSDGIRVVDLRSGAAVRSIEPNSHIDFSKDPALVDKGFTGITTGGALIDTVYAAGKPRENTITAYRWT